MNLLNVFSDAIFV